MDEKYEWYGIGKSRAKQYPGPNRLESCLAKDKKLSRARASTESWAGVGGRPAWWSRDLVETERALLEALSGHGIVGRQIVLEAIEVARRAHRLQTRGEGSPYLCHPLRVATSVITEAQIAEPTLVVAALLHDAAEDGPMRLEDLGVEFGEEVRELVEVLTRRAGKAGEGDLPGDQYVQAIEAAGWDAILLKVLDKLDNLRDSRFQPSEEKRLRCRREMERVYAPLAEDLERALGASLRRPIEAAVRESRGLATA